MNGITDARWWLSLLILLAAAPAFAVSGAFEDRIYETGHLKPVEKVSGKSN
ncbi:MAG: hypothetical protein K9K88_13745 [Desulfobacterales bacterium]|nr:hypothetical protein [Desulfobacterales bacterium]